MSIANAFDEERLKFFVEEIEAQSSFALRAYDHMHEYREPRERLIMRSNTSLGPSGDKMEHYFLFGYSFMLHVANISKLLWPVKKRFEDRGDALRKALGIADTSILRSRTTRDAFEHYDERIETWFLSPVRTHRNDLAVSVGGLHAHRGVNDHRLFDSSDMSFRFQDDEIKTQIIAVVLTNLHNKAEEWLVDHGYWDVADSMFFDT